MSSNDLLRDMEGCSFQGRQPAMAAKTLSDALDDYVLLRLGLEGAMVPAGMRKVVTAPMENNLVDIIVSTEADPYHDYFEAVGEFHYIVTPKVDDRELLRARVDRVYDTYADEGGFFGLDGHIGG